MDRTFFDLIYLCRCTVNKIQPDINKVHEMDMQQLYRLSKFHTLTALTAFALESCGMENNEFKQEKEKAIRKNMFLDSERMKLFDYCEQKGIWYMPLKGVILKDFYPKYGMRQMADNDILFDAKYQMAVKKYFQSNGYEVVSYNHGNHDVYKKPPVLNFEMHTSLFWKNYNIEWQSYYNNIKSKLIKDDGVNFGYHFSDEDFYIYITMHEYKHYSNGGTGLRSLLDCYIFLQKKKNTLDWQYIADVCLKLGISGFEKHRRKLAERIFSVGKPTELCKTERQILERYLNSGTYGTLKNSVESVKKEYYKRTGRSSKISYVLYRLFPDREWYERYNPFYNRYPYLKPFFVIFRLFRGAFFRKQKVSAELKMLKK